jgi:hypothetical protein
MANIQHSALTDPQLHEPKGASTAASGKVYVANGSGSGTWQFIAGHAYGDYILLVVVFLKHYLLLVL